MDKEEEAALRRLERDYADADKRPTSGFVDAAMEESRACVKDTMVVMISYSFSIHIASKVDRKEKLREKEEMRRAKQAQLMRKKARKE